MSRVRVTAAPKRWPTGPSGLPRVLLGRSGRALGLVEHVDIYGPPDIAGSRDVPAAVAEAGLRGHGGAGFPTATKMDAVGRGRGPKMLVANACEGERASAKDRMLVTRLPHLVLDGVELAARAVDAEQAFVAVDRTQGASAQSLLAAVDERNRAGLSEIPVRVVGVPGRYVAGEESALVHWLNGGEAKPTTVPPRPFERGVGGRPTLIQNVETLSHLALIARYGPEWFRTLGTTDEPGSALVTISGAVNQPGVSEIAMGNRIGSVLEAAGGASNELSAVLIGGYFGTWLRIEDALDVRLTNADLRRVGSSLGCGVIAALPSSSCPVVETARVLRYLAEETAGQCGPCVYGLASVSDAMAALARGNANRTVLQDLQKWGDVISRRGACHHPDGAIRLLRSTLVAFPEEIAAHRKGRCRATDHRPMLPIPSGPERDLGWR